MAAAMIDGEEAPSHGDIRLVISASALGTVFEWYDFFIYGTLAASGIIGRAFFPAGNETVQTLLAWAGFAVGFGFRPLGAALFGYLGDRLGRKYTFLVTITLMGIATAGVGLTPSAASIGYAAPAIVLLLRIAQGLALGGEYGGAAIYVAEHSPPGRSGFYTSFIQAGVVGGFILSLAVILLFKALVPGAAGMLGAIVAGAMGGLILCRGEAGVRACVLHLPVSRAGGLAAIAAFAGMLRVFGGALQDAPGLASTPTSPARAFGAPQTTWTGLPSPEGPMSTMQTRSRSAFGCC